MSMGKQSHRPGGLSEETDRIDRVVLPALRDAVAAFPEVERILLFGSRAKGDAEPRSDIDIAVSCPTASRRTWLEICRVAEEAETLLKIDVVRLEEAGPDFRERIDREGKVLYERR
jgi:predicted nucleotidyltransferase